MMTTSPQGLSRRVVLSFATLLTLVAGLYSVALYGIMEFTEEHLIGQMLDEDMTLLIDNDLRQGRYPRLSDVTVLYANKPVYGVRLPLIPFAFERLPEGFSETRGEEPGFAYRRRFDGYDLVMWRSQGGFEVKEIAIRDRALWALLLVSVIGVVAGWWLSERIMRPVKKLAAAIREAARSPVYQPLKIQLAKDEVGELAAICDEALRRLHDALAREKAFTGDVSHELRTPLTVIQTSLELLEMGSLNETQKAQLTRLARAAASMDRITTIFLILARNTRPTETDGGTPDTVSGIAAWPLGIWSEEARKKGLSFEIDLEEHCPGTYSPVLLSTVINNLLKNAVYYTRQGYVLFRTTKFGFDVIDTGPGIDTNEYDRIFKPYVRGVHATGEGVGLGLSLVARIAEIQGWQVRVSSRPGGGTVFSVTLVNAAHSHADASYQAG